MKNKVRELRTAKGLTQQELGDELRVSRQTIFSIETGKYVPTTILALRIASYFKTSVEEIFILESEEL